MTGEMMDARPQHPAKPPSLDDFFIPFEGKLRGALRATPTSAEEFVAIFACGRLRPDKPVPFAHDRGNKLVDWTSTTFACVTLISARLAELLREAKFTGWSTYPIVLTDEGDDPVDGYAGLSFDGRCGPFDDSKVPITLEPSPVTGKMLPVRKGFYFAIETWDGTDFFVPEGTTMGLITDRVRRLLEEHRIKNIFFERLTESIRI